MDVRTHKHAQIMCILFFNTLIYIASRPASPYQPQGVGQLGSQRDNLHLVPLRPYHVLPTPKVARVAYVRQEVSALLLGAEVGALEVQAEIIRAPRSG